MRVLILGGAGMLGHKLWQSFSPRFETHVTFRKSADTYEALGLFEMSHALGGVSADDGAGVQRALETIRPEVVVNCIGIVKQDPGARDPIASIAVNALFPQRLAHACRALGARLIHLSTDCVFSGRRGNYAEGDPSDAYDLYGRTKLLGEVDGEGCLTIRTSMIGRELMGSHGLLEWFLSQSGGRVRGFKNAVFSGLTTIALADVLAGVITAHADLSGVWHLAAAPINKFDLLSLIKTAYNLDIEIEPDEEFFCDRSLDGRRFRERTGIEAPSWTEMIARLSADPTPYEEMRRLHAAR